MTTIEIPRRPSSFRWISRTWRECYVFSPVLVAVLLVHGGFFFRAGSPFEQHFLAFSGLREAYIGLCCFAAILAVIEGLHRKRFGAGDLILLLVVLAFAFGSATFAYLKFGQPVFYGLFEERRVLLFFGMFLILAAYFQFSNRPEALVGAIYWAALIYLCLGLVMQTGLLGDLASRDIPDLDPRKYRILVGSDMYSISIVIGSVMIIRHGAWEHLVPVLVGVAGLLLISQTRSTIGIVIVAVGVIFALTSWRHFLVAAAGGVVGLVALFLWTKVSGGDLGVGNSVAELDVRVTTSRTILTELEKNDWLGMGALSLQWQNGFHRIYDKHFYLSDVGVVGEFYRFGIFLFVIYGGLAIAIFSYFRQPMDPRGRSIANGLFILFIINAFGAGLFAFVGPYLAILLALTVAFRKHEYAPRTLGSRLRLRL
ncbi:MAG: hypothetical protein MPJ78_17025 [Hyphomicrobiaceae bacterium]|nr:hypothetical protein [Hyphomicrobiaceae bacterium]